MAKFPVQKAPKQKAAQPIRTGIARNPTLGQKQIGIPASAARQFKQQDSGGSAIQQALVNQKMGQFK